MYGFIYITTNIINGKRYLGMSKHGKKGLYLGSGKFINMAIKKYGRENFTREILSEHNTKEELSDAEIKYIREFDCVESRQWYNVAPGGYTTRGFAGKTHSEERNRHVAKLLAGRKRPKHVGEAVSKAQKGISWETRHGKEKADARRKKQSEYLKQNSVLCTPITVDGIAYVSLSEAEAKTGISKYKLRKLISTP